MFASAALVGGGAVFGWVYLNRDRPNPLLEDLADGEVSLNQYLKITADNEVWIAVPRAEMGQGVLGGLAALVAEELDLRWETVHIFTAPPGEIYANNTAWLDTLPFLPYDRGTAAEAVRATTRWVGGLMGIDFTAASTSMRDGWKPMREAAAAARALLLDEAAERLDVERAELVVADRHVVHPATGGRLSFAALAPAAAQRGPPSEVALKPRESWNLIGQSLPRPDVKDKTTGAATFGIDVNRPDMLVATVRQNPHLAAPVLSFDAAAAKAVPGVEAVVQVDSGVAVIADGYWNARKGADALDVEWADVDFPPSTDAQLAELHRLVAEGDRDAFRDDGDAEDAYGLATRTIEATYSVPYLAHMTMEPMNGVAQFADGIVDIWVGSQAPSTVQQYVATALGLEPKQVRFHPVMLGGGFGRRAEMDYVVQVALLAKAMSPRPVKLIWSREEDVTHDFYRPAMVGTFRGAVGDDGFPTVLHAVTASQDVMPQYVPRASPGAIFPIDDVTSASGVFDQPYAIEHFLSEHVSVDWPLRIGNWRSVGLFGSGYMMESFIDELCVLGDKDPVDVRLHLLRDHKVAQNVVEVAAEMAGWGRPVPASKGRGLAFLAAFDAFIAQIVDVAFDEERGLVVEKVTCAVEVGTAINPRNIRNQIESGIVFGLSAAMLQRIDFEGGRVRQSNFHDFDVLRMHQTPEIEVRVLEEGEHLAGVGELGTAPIGAAFANAVSAATGNRLRSLPARDHMKVYG